MSWSDRIEQAGTSLTVGLIASVGLGACTLVWRIAGPLVAWGLVGGAPARGNRKEHESIKGRP